MSLKYYPKNFDGSTSIHLQRINNIRDLGGYQNSNGQVIRFHRLIRSEKLFNITSYDQKVLKNKYHLGVDIDLRNPSSIKYKPDVKMNSVKYIVAPVISDSEDYQNDILDNIDVPLGKYNTYHQFIITDQAKFAYRRLFSELLKVPNDKAVLYHCSEGKDRAGFATVLILKALGFNDDLIYYDYLPNDWARMLLTLVKSYSFSNYYLRHVNLNKIFDMKN